MKSFNKYIFKYLFHLLSIFNSLINFSRLFLKKVLKFKALSKNVWNRKYLKFKLCRDLNILVYRRNVWRMRFLMSVFERLASRFTLFLLCETYKYLQFGYH